MKNSRSSRLPKNSWLAWLAAVSVVLGLVANSAEAGRRRRIVVLDFEGPKAEKFQAGVVKLIKRAHTVVTIDVWNRVAEELNASKLTEKNIKKVARKLKVDGIVTGEIEKRRDEYLIRLKLKAGTTGELVGGRIDTKSRTAKLDAKAQRDIKDELIAAVDELELNRGGSDVVGDGDGDASDADVKPKKNRSDAVELTDDGEDTEAAPPAKPKPSKSGKSSVADMDEEAETPPAKRPKPAKDTAVDDEPAADAKPERASKRGKSKTFDESDDLGKSLPRDTASPRSKKSVSQDDAAPDRAGRGRDDEPAASIRSGAETNAGSQATLTPGNRAIDIVVGTSLNVRRLQFQADNDLVDSPPSYRQSVPVAGALLDATLYPFAFTPNRKKFLAGVGVQLMYDRVLFIKSQRKYVDNMMQQQIADLQTTQDRFSVGIVLRYPVGERLVIGGKALYSSQRFDVAQQLPNNTPTDVPSVGYTMIEPKLFTYYLLTRSLALSAEGGVMLVRKSGDIETAMTGYGATSTSGFEASAGIEYNVTRSIFVRVAGRLERFSLTFQGDANSLANTRDGDAMQDVRGATDLYFGGIAAIGYAY